MQEALYSHLQKQYFCTMGTIKDAIKVLDNGGTILYPTDTIWGIGCDATNTEAVKKVIDLKGRDSSKSFIILVDSFHMLEKYVKDFPEVCYDLIEVATHPLTIIYDNPIGIAKNALAKDNSLGIRLTQDNVCVKLIRGIKKPIVSTSANFSGKPAAISYKNLDPELIKTVDCVVEENLERENVKPSSIIKIGADSSVKVIR